MPRRPKRQNQMDIITQVENAIVELRRLQETDAVNRERIKQLVIVRRVINDYGASFYPDADSAKLRIISYLIDNLGEIVESEELAAVSGIQESARRIRELRIEYGYRIVSGVGDERGELKPDQYILLDPEPDKATAERWKLANEIRNQGGGAKERILKFLKENVGNVVTGDELAYVANISEWPRRVRELRSEEGWHIATKALGRPDINVGEYVLESLEQSEPHERHISEEVSKEVYARDNNQCVVCGWSRLAWTPTNPRYLELHHRIRHRDKGANTVNNLEVRCNICHKQAHR